MIEIPDSQVQMYLKDLSNNDWFSLGSLRMIS
jgi:hypothetical protein